MARKKAIKQQQSVADPADDGPVQGSDEISTKAWKCWREGTTHQRDWLTEAKECYDITAGHQWTEDEMASLKEQMRPIVTFNRAGVVIDSVSGYQINNRQDITYLPREVGDSGPVQVETEAAKYFRQQCDAEDEESDAFVDLVTAGVGWIEHRMDYDDDPDGMLSIDRVDGREMRYDPTSTKRNLIDRRWDVRGKWWPKTVAKETWPKHDWEASENISGDVDDAESQPVVRELAAYYLSPGGQQTDLRKDKVFILEYTWFDRDPFISALNPATQKLEEISEDDLKSINEKIAQVQNSDGTIGQPPLKSVKRFRKKFKRAFVHGRDTLNPDDLDAPCPTKFHYQAMTGKRDRNKNLWFGLVRAMKDPQRWANKFLSQVMHMINANAKGGLIHDEGAFENPMDVERRMAKPGWRIAKRQGYEATFVPPAMIPTNTFQLMQFAIGSMRDTTGVNLELLGMADREQPGILEHSRKQAAMAILAPFFDNLRRYHKESGRLTLYFIKEYLSDGRLIRIVSEGQKKFIPLTQAQGFDKYDVIVDQSPSSPNSKEATFAVLSGLMPVLLKAGVPIPPDIIDYVPGLPAELAEKWKQMLLPQQNPAAEAAQKLEMAEKKADIEKTQADTLLSETKAAGEIAKIIPLLQQVLAGLGVISQVIPGGAEVESLGPTVASPGASGGQPPMPPPEMPPPPGMPPPDGGMPLPPPQSEEPPPMIPPGPQGPPLQ